MIAAAAIGQEIGTCAEETAQRIRSAVMAYGPLPPVTARTEDIVARLAADKKAVAGAIHFVLPWTIGKTKIVNDVPMGVVTEAIGKTLGGLPYSTASRDRLPRLPELPKFEKSKPMQPQKGRE